MKKEYDWGTVRRRWLRNQLSFSSKTIPRRYGWKQDAIGPAKKLPKECGLPTKMERMQMKGFRPVKIKTLTSASGQLIMEIKKTTLKGVPNSITQKTSGKGGIERNYYDNYGRQSKQISNNDHDKPKQHPYGKKGEHTHDHICDTKGILIDRPIRELTDTERKENSAIL